MKPIKYIKVEYTIKKITYTAKFQHAENAVLFMSRMYEWYNIQSHLIK